MVLEYHGQFDPNWTGKSGLLSFAASNPFYLPISFLSVNLTQVRYRDDSCAFY